MPELNREVRPQGKEQIPQDLDRPASDAALLEYCDRNYHQLLPIIAEKVHQEKVQQEKLKAVKASLNFEEVSQHSESGTLSRRWDLKKRPGSGQEVKIVHEDTGSQNPSGRSRALRTIYPNHGDVKGALECIKISGFMHEITNPELINCLHDKILKSVDELMRVTTTFLQAKQEQNFKKGGFRNQQRSKRKHDMFTLLTKTPKEILALYKGKFKPSPPMTTPVEKRNATKFCEFHREVGHTTDECMHLKRQIEKMLKVRKLSHVIKELKKNNAKDQTKAAKRGNFKKGQDAGNIDGTTMAEDSQTKNYPNFLSKVSDLFPTLWGGGWDEGPMIIEADMGGHFVHRMYVDGAPLKKSSMNTASIGQLSLLVKIGDKKHSTFAWMNFMLVRSPSSYNGIIGRPGRDYSARMHNGLRTRAQQPVIDQATEEKIQVVIHPEYPEQTIAIGSTLTEEGRKELCEHRLNIHEGCLPVRQKKISTKQEVIRDIEEMFKILREINMKLNPKKCTFGMREDMLLGYKVNADGLKVCLDKVEMVLNLPSPKCLKDVQKLNEKLTSLNKFLSKSAEKSLPFFKTLKKCTKKWILMDYGGGNNIQTNEEIDSGIAYANYFIVERPKDDSRDTPMKDKEELSDPWILFTDGSSCVDEYEALIAGIRITKKMGVKNLQANVDSRLVANQVNETYVAKEPGMIKYLKNEKSIDEKEVLAIVEEEGRTWMTPIYEYLTKEILPEEKMKARAIRRNVGIDIAVPLLKSPGKVKFLIVEIDYFTKWIEAKPVATITGAQVKKFMWDNIVCRFGLPGDIIFDNGKQFKDNLFKDWCENYLFVNASLSLSIHRPTVCNGETSFSLTYGTEAVIPIEIGMPTLRTAEVDMIKNDEALEINLDLLEEKREHASIQEEKSKAKMEKYYNARVRNKSFKLGDLIYQNNEANHTEN
uniref:Reverse transcriptase domain-containing protein n=1 Tax=Tanacetum cinerariifolium TaxID=118510 RepID=A0A699H2W7_TANCI|nr:reverse transcriptase domain-containing protein [Tanacetum cinerariifolium]